MIGESYIRIDDRRFFLFFVVREFKPQKHKEHEESPRPRQTEGAERN